MIEKLEMKRSHIIQTENGETGLVEAPDPIQLMEKINELVEAMNFQRELTEKMIGVMSKLGEISSKASKLL